jgi:hypothetical protein
MFTIDNISLFIPHVFPNFSKEYVTKTFQEYGDIDHIDFVAKQDRSGKSYNAVYIHFKEWYNILDNRNFQARLLSGSEVKVYHDHPWYWIVLPNNAKKHVSGDRKPRIDLGDEKAISVSSFKTPEKPILKRSEKVEIPAAPVKPIKKSYAEVVEPISTLSSEWTDTQNQFNTDIESESKYIDEPSFEELEKRDREMDEIEDELYADDLEAQMNEIENELNAEDSNLVTIDSRYIQAIEQENTWLNCEVAQLRLAIINLHQMYQAEVAKVKGLSMTTD